MGENQVKTNRVFSVYLIHIDFAVARFEKFQDERVLLLEFCISFLKHLLGVVKSSWKLARQVALLRNLFRAIERDNADVNLDL